MMVTVVEADLADGQILDGVGFVVPVRPHAGDCGGLVAHVGPDVSGGGDGFGRAHDVVGHFDDVDADVDHGAAALFVFLAEDAPVGIAAAAEGLAFDEHDFAEFSFVAGLGEEFCGGVEVVLEADGEFFLFLRGSVDHFLAFFGEHGHGFFGGGVGAGVERVNDGGGVATVGVQTSTASGFYFGEHFLPVGEDIRNAVGFAGPLEAFIAVDVDGGDEFDIGEFFAKLCGSGGRRFRRSR